ncbi:MAG: lytic transglycosylase domain-containing protein [Aquificae bacterium]|nr:lytic transglycosylase domain-containing protein [Aquificota bacterium]
MDKKIIGLLIIAGGVYLIYKNKIERNEDIEKKLQSIFEKALKDFEDLNELFKPAKASQENQIKLRHNDPNSIITCLKRLGASREEIALLMAIAETESNFKNVPNAEGSSAFGYWQIIRSTRRGVGCYDDNRFKNDLCYQANCALKLLREIRRINSNPEYVMDAWCMGSGNALKLKRLVDRCKKIKDKNERNRCIYNATLQVQYAHKCRYIYNSTTKKLKAYYKWIKKV